MKLFPSDPITNLLPYDGDVSYQPDFLQSTDAAVYYKTLLNTIPWENDKLIIYNKHIMTRRKIAWFGDQDYAYHYSNTTKKALPWTQELLELKQKIEFNESLMFNSCLLNLYHSGEEGISWHSDDEKELGRNTTIASLNLGAERKFSFKHKKSKMNISIILEAGSLLIMKGVTQYYWLHSLPKTTKIKDARINLTFRTFTG